MPTAQAPFNRMMLKTQFLPFLYFPEVAQRSLSKSAGPVPSVPEATEDPEERTVVQHVPFLTDPIKSTLSAYGCFGYMTRQLMESRL